MSRAGTNFIETAVKIPSTNPEFQDLFPHLNGTLVAEPVGAAVDPLHPARQALILIVHGQYGHSNYCYQQELAAALARQGLASLRFDFSGCGSQLQAFPEHLERPRLFASDMPDLAAVVEWAESHGFWIMALVGHSRGAMVSLEFLAREHSIPLMVNCSGRYRAELILDRFKQDGQLRKMAGFWSMIKKPGESELVEKYTKMDELLDIAKHNMKNIRSRLNPNLRVLTIFGARDHIVPVQDFALWAGEFGDMGQYALIQDADHNFFSLSETGDRINHNHLVVDTICEFLGEKQLIQDFYRKTRYISVARWKEVEGVLNFRDTAGFLPRFPHSFLFRCADLQGLTDKGAQQLSKLVAIIFDIRSMPEIKKNGTIGPKHAEIVIPRQTRRIHVPIFPETDYSPQEIAKRLQWYGHGNLGFVQAYRGILSSLGPTLKIIFRETAALIQSGDPRGILIHCSAGKDRTGVIVALFHLLAGLDSESISREYELTETGLAPWHDRILTSVGPKRLSMEQRVKMRKMMGAEADAMRMTLRVIESEYGGWQWLLESHVEPADLLVVKAHLRGEHVPIVTKL
ncbi:hypothetical protein HDU91_006870 [Kappamyces sp. JEL0680]|nr:hypothetical protein HDU91_006870 [Kappamyces sp. JEL0680]